jgi:hypothetical protein
MHLQTTERQVPETSSTLARTICKDFWTASPLQKPKLLKNLKKIVGKKVANYIVKNNLYK